MSRAQPWLQVGIYSDVPNLRSYDRSVNPRTAGGAVIRPPPPQIFSQIAEKRRRVAPPNLL